MVRPDLENQLFFTKMASVFALSTSPNSRLH